MKRGGRGWSRLEVYEPILDARDDELVALEAGSEDAAERLVICLFDQNDNELRRPAWSGVIDLCIHAGYPRELWYSPDPEVPVQMNFAEVVLSS